MRRNVSPQPLAVNPDMVLAILTGDWHLRDDQPVCRKDDYRTAQRKMLRWMCQQQKTYRCPALHGPGWCDGS